MNTAQAGEIVINEFMTYNATRPTDATGAHDDWIELFNTTGNPLSLLGLHITDDYNNHFKCALPDVIIPAYGFVLIWADEDIDLNEVHAKFQLASVGEYVLLSHASGAVLDSVAYGIIPGDQSYGRCPNGYGPWMVYSSPSFNGWNICPGNVAEQNVENGVSVYPNPVEDILNVVKFDDALLSYEVVSATGQVCKSGTFIQEQSRLDFSGLASGMYMRMVRDEFGQLLSAERIIRQ